MRPRSAIAAISPDAARAAGAGWERVEVADAPNDAALLALAARLCNNPAAMTGTSRTGRTGRRDW